MDDIDLTWTGLGPSRTRRVLDIVVSLVALAFWGLPLLLAMAAIRLGSRGPALFRQTRVGQGGREFVLLKLRSMRVDSDGPEITTRGDTRVTRVGRLIRATSVDELPQLVNVLRGDMTLVGPRPETPALAAGYPPECRWVFSYRPGLTGPAQIRMRDGSVLDAALASAASATAAYLDVVVPERTRIEARYLNHPSLPATVSVIRDTARHILGLEVSGRL